MKILLAVIYITGSILFGQTKDTVIKADLNFDGTEETLKFSYDPDAMRFILTLKDFIVDEGFIDSYDADIKIIDINRNDGSRDILITGYGSSDQSDMHFYQYWDNKIIQTGHLPSNFGIEVTGNSEITEFAWMGFWTAKLKYNYDFRKKTITKVIDEFYDVGQVCEVKNSFSLMKTRKDVMDISAVLKPGTKLYIIKADLSPECDFENGEPDDFSCDWYFIKTDDGLEGWCRLKDFQNNVDGLIWAG